MATEPKTTRETRIVIEGLNGRLNLITTMVVAVLGLLGALYIGGNSLNAQLGDIKKDVGKVQGTAEGIDKRLEGLDAEIREIRTAQTAAATTLARIDEATKQRTTYVSGQVPPDPPEKVAAFPPNAQLIRSLIKPMPTGSRTYAVGNVVTGAPVLLLPSDIVAKLPELRGLGYVVDAKAAIALVDPSYRVVAVIAPS
jgi:hypothetical protein